MSLIGQGAGAKRPSYGTGVYLTRYSLRALVSSLWPRPRKRRPTLYEKSIQDRLTRVVFYIKRLNDREVEPTRQAINAVNRRHRGLRGSAAIRIEDWNTARLYGRLWAIHLPNGRLAIHRDALQDVSRRLDWFEPRVGSLLTRTNTGWLPTVQCDPGARLTLTAGGTVQGCCKPASLADDSDAVPL